VCSSLASISSSFPSVSNRHDFCFLCIKSPVVLSLFTQLWIVSLLGTLSSRNLCWHFLADPYVSYINIALKYTAPWHTTLLTSCKWEQMANGANNCCLLLTNNNQTPKHEPHCSPWNNAIKQSTS
jgi:hypothetical protein